MYDEGRVILCGFVMGSRLGGEGKLCSWCAVDAVHTWPSLSPPQERLQVYGHSVWLPGLSACLSLYSHRSSVNHRNKQ
ncbi:hypothetical protein HBI56_229300 [Parastagonospora nodorum]|nr:hypothetical protein HBH52_122820 [Parastagonospora nodorum]KAH4000390.1 hypothetical protein HBI10_098760 [Parastagonospora nodorum]KAH4026797.1 hypothetical protein HBI13_066840 [Parastagonospora nodorum]KAH4089797.1 hypothetical protein HBH46_192410 [Parastagonospora nodorum]KAH4127033.1 hypothetical protein HBH47_045600 [Parastagonospora nodorum]